MGKEPTALDALKQSVVETASAAVVAAMTPEMMSACAEDILKQVLSTLSEDTYGSLGRLVKDRAEKATLDYLQTAKAELKMREAVREGVDAAMGDLPEQVKGLTKDLALKGMADAIETKVKRGR